MPKEIIFESGNFVIQDSTEEEENVGGAYLPSRKTARKIFNQGPLPVKLTFNVECTCGSKPHLSACAISRNGHSQILVLDCPDKSQIQCSGAHKIKADVPLAAA